MKQNWSTTPCFGKMSGDVKKFFSFFFLSFPFPINWKRVHRYWCINWSKVRGSLYATVKLNRIFLFLSSFFCSQLICTEVWVRALVDNFTLRSFPDHITLILQTSRFITSTLQGSIPDGISVLGEAQECFTLSLRWLAVLMLPFKQSKCWPDRHQLYLFSWM